MDTKSDTRHGEIVLEIVNLFPARPVSRTSDVLLLVAKIADLVEKIENDAFIAGNAEGLVHSHAAHELEQDNLQKSIARRVRDAWESGYREGYDDGNEGRFHQVDGKE